MLVPSVCNIFKLILSSLLSITYLLQMQLLIYLIIQYKSTNSSLNIKDRSILIGKIGIKLEKHHEFITIRGVLWLRGQDLNLRPPGYECKTLSNFIFCINAFSLFHAGLRVFILRILLYSYVLFCYSKRQISAKNEANRSSGAAPVCFILYPIFS